MKNFYKYIITMMIVLLLTVSFPIHKVDALAVDKDSNIDAYTRLLESDEIEEKHRFIFLY